MSRSPRPSLTTLGDRAGSKIRARRRAPARPRHASTMPCARSRRWMRGCAQSSSAILRCLPHFSPGCRWSCLRPAITFAFGPDEPAEPGASGQHGDRRNKRTLSRIGIIGRWRSGEAGWFKVRISAASVPDKRLSGPCEFQVGDGVIEQTGDPGVRATQPIVHVQARTTNQARPDGGSIAPSRRGIHENR